MKPRSNCFTTLKPHFRAPVFDISECHFNYLSKVPLVNKQALRSGERQKKLYILFQSACHQSINIRTDFGRQCTSIKCVWCKWVWCKCTVCNVLAAQSMCCKRYSHTGRTVLFGRQWRSVCHLDSRPRWSGYPHETDSSLYVIPPSTQQSRGERNVTEKIRHHTLYNTLICHVTL